MNVFSSTDFWTGVGASLAAALIGYLIVTVALPMFMRFLRRGPKIYGKWTTHDALDKDAAVAGEATIIQVGKRVYIKVKRIRKRGGADMKQSREFKYRGVFESGNVSAVYKDKSAQYATGAIVLHLVPADKKMIGKTMYYEDGDGSGVQCFDFCLRR